MHTFIKMPEVRKRTSLGRSTIYKKMAENSFPKPVSLGANSVAWLEEDIINWQEERIKVSRGENASFSTAREKEEKFNALCN